MLVCHRRAAQTLERITAIHHRVCERCACTPHRAAVSRMHCESLAHTAACSVVTRTVLAVPKWMSQNFLNVAVDGMYHRAHHLRSWSHSARSAVGAACAVTRTPCAMPAPARQSGRCHAAQLRPLRGGTHSRVCTEPAADRATRRPVRLQIRLIDADFVVPACQRHYAALHCVRAVIGVAAGSTVTALAVAHRAAIAVLMDTPCVYHVCQAPILPIRATRRARSWQMSTGEQIGRRP